MADTPALGSREEKRGRWDGALCAAVCLCALLLARPFVEIGLIDDFSYVRTAWDFARTGHFVYNGWATAMLGWQIVWAAPFVRLMGDSFFAPRVSVVVLFVFLVLLLHALAQRFGLRREHAAFATLLTGLSPLTLPLAATFMTDISGMLVTAVCLYCTVRALRAGRGGAVLGWLAASFILGAAGGTARQIAWLCPLVLSPSAAWLLRRRRGVVPVAVALWVASFGTILLCLRWFARQPYSVPEQIKGVPHSVEMLRTITGGEAGAILVTLLLLVPVFAVALGSVRQMRWKALAGVIVAALLLTAVGFALTRHGNEGGWMPWTSDIISRMDVFNGRNLWAFGDTPATFTTRGRAVASVVVMLFAATFVMVVWQSKLREPAVGGDRFSWHEIGFLLLPFTLAYLVLLVPRAMAERQVLDRYMLPLLMLAAICLLRLCQERVAPRLPAASWAVLLVFSMWSIASLHDFAAGFRARLQAVQRMEAAGIPPREMNVGWEFDGMEQITLAGAVYDHRVTYPASFDTDPHLPAGLPAACRSLFLYNTPALRQRYFLAYDTPQCLVPSQFADVPVSRWLPPYHVHFHILKLAY